MNKFAEACLFAIVLPALLLSVSLAISTTWHEEAHKQIFRQYGCENVTIEYNSFHMGGTTTCHDVIDYPPDAIMLNVQNEIVYYNLRVILMALFLALSALIMVLMVK